MRTPWLLPTEAARHLGVSRSRILQLFDSRKLRGIKTETGRRLLSRADLERFLRDRAKSKHED